MKFPYLLRSDQLEALSQLNAHDHLIYIAATGSGKSVLFQKYLHDHPKIRAVLISPLNALSRQQAERFLSLGIPVFQKNAPSHDDVGVWILSPEKLQGRTLSTLEYWKPSFLIVDEAHCIWEWGREFRPAYRKTLELSKLPSIRKTLWCSATLPQIAQRELFAHLKTHEKNRVKILGQFELPKQMNLRSEKISPEIRLNWLRNRLGLYADQSGLVFCNTRSAAEAIQKYLKLWGVTSFFYHAGLSREEKLNLEKRLLHQRESSLPMVVVATSAFGMGMDYAFFQFCILFEPPFSILSLVQAIGRVGRSGQGSVSKTARAHVLWHPVDFARNKAWIDQTEVYEWCRSLENPATCLENYFNGAALSGTINEDGHTGNNSLRTSSSY